MEPPSQSRELVFPFERAEDEHLLDGIARMQELVAYLGQIQRSILSNQIDIEFHFRCFGRERPVADHSNRGQTDERGSGFADDLGADVSI